MSFYNQQDLKPKIVKINNLSSGRNQRVQGVESLPLKTAQQIALADTHKFEKHLGHRKVRVIYSSQSMSQRQGWQGHSSQNKGAGRCHFHPLPPDINTRPPVGTSELLILSNSLTPGLSPLPHVLVDPSFSAMLTSFLVLWVYLPRRQAQTTANTSSVDLCILWAIDSSDGSSGRFHSIRRPVRTLLKYTPSLKETKHSPQQAKRASVDEQTEKKVAKTQQQSTHNMHKKHQALGNSRYSKQGTIGLPLHKAITFKSRRHSRHS